jgi:hypothetical protein
MELHRLWSFRSVGIVEAPEGVLLNVRKIEYLDASRPPEPKVLKRETRRKLFGDPRQVELVEQG